MPVLPLRHYGLLPDVNMGLLSTVRCNYMYNDFRTQRSCSAQCGGSGGVVGPPPCVCVSALSYDNFRNKCPLTPDIWYGSSPWSYPDHVRNSRSPVTVQGHG